MMIIFIEIVQNKFLHFEVSCKIPPQTATFPAFWLADHGSYTSATGESRKYNWSNRIYEIFRGENFL